MFRGHTGCLGVLFLRGADRTVGACSLWASQDCIDALATSPTYTTTVDLMSRSGLVESGSNVVVYEVDGGQIDPNDLSATITLPEPATFDTR
jgi:hypothetical protein